MWPSDMVTAPVAAMLGLVWAVPLKNDKFASQPDPYIFQTFDPNIFDSSPFAVCVQKATKPSLAVI